MKLPGYVKAGQRLSSRIHAGRKRLDRGGQSFRFRSGSSVRFATV